MWRFREEGVCIECELHTKIDEDELCELCYML